MTEYVDREALLNELEKINPVDYGWIGDYEVHLGCRNCLRDCKSTVNTLQSADVAPVVHGRWGIFDGYKTRRVCSVCGWDVPEYGKFYSYCPNCGARMECNNEAIN